MTSVSVNLYGDRGDHTPEVQVLRHDADAVNAGQRFAVLRFGYTADVILPGNDLSAAAFMRQTATALLKAADNLAAAIVEEESALETV